LLNSREKEILSSQAIPSWNLDINNNVSIKTDQCEKTSEFEAVQSINPWTNALKSLKDEISLRHYSPKTLSAYSLWANKLRFFIEDKQPDQLTADDVKKFLTWLAVKQQVSASSQNQAFNALLFFFRHVLKKEFGKIDGVVKENHISRLYYQERRLTWFLII